MFVEILLTCIIVFLSVIIFIERRQNAKRESELLNRLMSKNFTEFSLITRAEQDNLKPHESSIAESERGG